MTITAITADAINIINDVNGNGAKIARIIRDLTDASLIVAIADHDRATGARKSIQAAATRRLAALATN